MTHRDSIELINSFGLDFFPEAKTPHVPMPFKNFTQAQFAQKIIDEYKAAGISPKRVWPQSFLPNDVFYWLGKNEDTAHSLLNELSSASSLVLLTTSQIMSLNSLSRLSTSSYLGITPKPSKPFPTLQSAVSQWSLQRFSHSWRWTRPTRLSSLRRTR